MNQGQAQADGDGGEALRGAGIRGAENDNKEHGGHDDFRNQGGNHSVSARRVFAETVGGESGGRVKPGLACGDDIQNTAGGNGANVPLEAGMTITWGAPGGTHEFSHMGNSPADFALMQGYLDTSDSSTTTVTVNGVKFPLYDIIVYGDGDNGSATRVGKYTLTATRGSGTKYILDASDTDFAGSFLEADSPTGGAAAAAGNYCRFRDVRGTTFTVTATGEYASDGHPRGPLNAIQIVPINVVPALSDFSYSQFQFWLNGSTGAAYTIESSSDLTRWTPIGTYIAPTQVAVPGGPQHCFYRAVQTQPYDDVPVLSAPSRRGQVQFSLSGATNMNYIIQASTNLVNWTAVSTNRAPARANPGQEGIERTIWLRLKLIADAGLVGLPNAGKSTFLAAVSNARPKIADYPFTTLVPNLGVVGIDGHEFVMADIPGLIEGASEGRGLGTQFLAHVERCKVLLHLVDGTSSTITKDFKTIVTELEAYSDILGDKQRIVALNKTDAMDARQIADRKRALEKASGGEVHVISGVSGKGLPQVLRVLYATIQGEAPVEESGPWQP